jgi:hypothetical protein
MLRKEYNGETDVEDFASFSVIHSEIIGSLIKALCFQVNMHPYGIYVLPSLNLKLNEDKNGTIIPALAIAPYGKVKDKIEGVRVAIDIEQSPNSLEFYKNRAEICLSNSIREHWLVFTGDEGVRIFNCEQGGKALVSATYKTGAVIKSRAVQGLNVRVKDIYAQTYFRSNPNQDSLTDNLVWTG